MFLSGVGRESLIGRSLLLIGDLGLWDPLVGVEGSFPWVFDSGI